MYRLSKIAGLKMTPHTTMDQLSKATSMISSEPEYARGLFFNAMVIHLSSPQLAQMYLSAPTIDPEINRLDEDELELNERTYLEFEQTLAALTTRVLLYLRVDPVDSIEAIALAAKNFFCDISKAYSPINEYHILRRSLGNYIPKTRPCKRYSPPIPTF